MGEMVKQPLLGATGGGKTPAATPSTTAGSSPSTSFLGHGPAAKVFPRAAEGTDNTNGAGHDHEHGHVGAQPRNDHKIGMLSLASLIFFSVSGGPYGMEEAIKTAGPLVTMLALVVLPLVWSVPEALVTCELAPTFPEPSGSVAWVSYAFGPFWGWTKGYLSWLSGVTDNSLYPVLIVDYIFTFFKSEVEEAGLDKAQWDRTAVLFGLTAILTYLNWRGLDVVGNAVTAISAISLLPFLILVAAGFWQGIDWGRLAELPAGGWGGVQWQPFLTIVFWNINYWDNTAPFAADVKNPARTFPRAMALAMVVVILSTALPLLVSVGATTFAYADFTDGFFATVAESVVGKWLGAWIVFSSAIASVGMFEGEMSSDSFQLMGMAERGMLPAVFAKRSRHGTPTLAVLFSAGGILVLSLMSFLEIVELLNTLYILSTMIEYAAFLKLRFAHPELPRPWRIPLGNHAMCALLSLPMAFLVYILYLAPLKTWVILGASLLVGCALYWGLAHPATRACCRFRAVPGEGGAFVPPDGSSDEEGSVGGEDDGGGEEMGLAGAGEEIKEEGKRGRGGRGGGPPAPGLLRYGSDGDYVAV